MTINRWRVSLACTLSNSTTGLPELVPRDAPQEATIGRLEGRWRREFGGQAMAWDEAWLWAPDHGHAIFEQHPRLAWVTGDCERWILHRVWLRREWRRRGLLSAAWAVWEQRYGAFEVTLPNEAMTAFLVAR